MHNIVGKKVTRVDGYEKVTGKAIFGDDIQLKGMLHAANRYTDIPCGKITRIDISKAEKIEGVEAIALYKDIPGQTRLGPIRHDQYPIVNDQVFFSGDVVAVVSARTKEIACLAADAIEIEYEAIEGIYEVEEAIKPDARLIHPEFKSNEVVHYPLRKGNIEKGFADSDHILERTYRTNFHEHGYIEPESVVVSPDATTKGYKVFGSIQNPFTTRKVVALFMNVNLNQVTVNASNMGGSFGGKDDIVNYMACRAALLAKMTVCPVKLSNTREDSIKESYKRHPYIMKYKVGFNNDGKLNAMKIDILADSGAYSSQSFFVIWRSVVQATGPYEIENVETDIRAIYTNNTYTAAFRGFGSPQVIFAQESLMDEIATICKISPLEIRQKNGFRQNSVTASGKKLEEHKVALNEVVNKAIEKSEYHKKIAEYESLNKQNTKYKYGIGLSCSYRGCSLGAEGTDASSAVVSVQADGSVIVHTGVNENGQGLRTTMCMIASEVLGVKYENITFLEPHTGAITDGGPTVASRGTLVGGNAIIQAAEIVRNRIFDVIKTDLQVDELSETEWKNGVIKNIVNPNIPAIIFKDAAFKTHHAGFNLSAYGWFEAPNVNWDEHTGQGNAYFTYVYGCNIAEIKVDTSTGKIDVSKMTAVHDVGKVINRIGAEGQVYGGVMQGIGYSVLEDYNIQNGVVKSTNVDEYLLPTIKDVPVIDIELIENEDKFGPFGAKSMGEPVLELASAAINNALFFATGKRSYQIPLTLEQVFLDKNLRKPSRQSETQHRDSCKTHIVPDKVSPRVNNINTITAKTLNDALELISKDEYKLMAGGTDVIIGLRFKNEPTTILNISGLNELKGISANNSVISIGAGTSFTEIIENESIKSNFPMLVEACASIGSKQIRNRGTIGGNLVNAAPCADSVPPLMAYNAKLILTSKSGKREILVNDFIVKNYQTQIRQDEILTSIEIPISKLKYYHSYFQLGRRNAVNITRLSFGALVAVNQNHEITECKIVTGSLFDRPLSLDKIANLLVGKKLLIETIQSIEEPLKTMIDCAIGKRWSSEYKMPVALKMCRDVLMDVMEKVGF